MLMSKLPPMKVKSLTNSPYSEEFENGSGEDPNFCNVCGKGVLDLPSGQKMKVSIDLTQSSFFF